MVLFDGTNVECEEYVKTVALAEIMVEVAGTEMIVVEFAGKVVVAWTETVVAVADELRVKENP